MVVSKTIVESRLAYAYGTCTREFSSPVDTSLGLSALYLELAIAALIRVGEEVASPPISTDGSITVEILPIGGVFKFYKLYHPTLWPFGKMLRAPLGS